MLRYSSTSRGHVLNLSHYIRSDHRNGEPTAKATKVMAIPNLIFLEIFPLFSVDWSFNMDIALYRKITMAKKRMGR